ncbi:hypothetical protein ACFX13_007490 [Malus domestica]
MASRNDQAIPTTNAKNKNILVASGGTLGVTTQSKTIALFAVSSILSQEQEHPRNEPVITLASLRASREESPMRYSESLTSDDDSSNNSYPVAMPMQVMTTYVTSIEEQLAQISEAIATLIRTMEEKNLQIDTLINRLEAQHDKKVDPKVDPPKKETDKENEPMVEKAKDKLEMDRATTFMRSLSIQQLQEMITNTIKT